MEPAVPEALFILLTCLIGSVRMLALVIWYQFVVKGNKILFFLWKHTANFRLRLKKSCGVFLEGASNLFQS